MRLSEDGKLRVCIVVLAALVVALGVGRDSSLDVPEVALAGVVMLAAWWPPMWRDDEN